MRVGDGRLVTAASVAGGAGYRARALWTDPQPTETIDTRDRTASRADLAQFHDRKTQRQTAARLEAIDARDFQTACGLRLSVIHEAKFCGGAADVEQECFGDTELERKRGREYRTSRRAGFKQRTG